DPHLTNGRTNEVVVGVERELGTDFSVSANFNYRVYSNFEKIIPDGISTADYVPGGIFTASTVLADFSVPYLSLPFQQDGTAILTNIKDYKQSYRGLDVTFNKRMSHQFFLNGGFNLQSETGHYHGGDSLAVQAESNVLGEGATLPFDPT